MAIQVTCKCGKTIAAPENLAGKKVKCPACSESLTIPTQNQSASAGKAAQKSKTPVGIKATCACGKTVSVQAALAGKKVKCPACSQLLQIPMAKPQTSAATVQRKPESESNLTADDGIGDLLDDVDLSATTTGQRCPECRTDLSEDDVLCVNCGYHLELGRKISTKKVDEPKESVAVQKRKKKKPKSQKSKMNSQTMGILILILIYGIGNAISYYFYDFLLIPGRFWRR